MSYQSIVDEMNFHNLIENQRYYYEEENKEINAMRSLWRAVITQALMDAASSSKKKYYIADKARARAWLKGYSDDFIEVCMLADLDPNYVRSQAKIAMSRNYKWRDDARISYNFFHPKA